LLSEKNDFKKRLMRDKISNLFNKTIVLIIFA